MTTEIIPPPEFTAAEETLIKMINKDNGTRLLPGYITVGVPQSNPPGSFRNTTVNIAALEGADWFGSKGITYNRILVDVKVGNANKMFTQQAELTTVDLLPRINEQCHLSLVASDIFEENLPVFEQSTVENALPFTLHIATTSLLYQGSVILQLGRSNPQS